MYSVYIQGGLRSPIGVYGGQYKLWRPEQLGATLLKSWLARRLAAIDTSFRVAEETWLQRAELYNLLPDLIIGGNAVGTGGNLVRLMALEAGLPVTVPAFTVDMQCASGAMAIAQAYALLKSGVQHHIWAGGLESSSLQPVRKYAPGDNRQGNYMVAQFSPEENDALAMLKGAERVIKKYAITKEELYRWVLRSHERAAVAIQKGYLRPYMATEGIWQTYTDEGIRPHISEKLLNRLPSLLGKDSLVTAGTSCLTHDGAAWLSLSHDKSPFQILHVTVWSGEPLYSPEGAWQVTEKLLGETGLTMSQLDAVEWNEAFAAIDVLFERAYPRQTEIYNSLGGALAYGHPYGASGAIILLHLMAALQQRKGRYGVAAIAGAGGTGVAILVSYEAPEEALL